MCFTVHELQHVNTCLQHLRIHVCLLPAPVLQALQEELSLRDKTVFIQNLPPNCTEQELINALQLCGDVSVTRPPSLPSLLCLLPCS